MGEGSRPTGKAPGCRRADAGGRRDRRGAPRGPTPAADPQHVARAAPSTGMNAKLIATILVPGAGWHANGSVCPSDDEGRLRVVRP
jgi:hypothetical protein